MSGGRYSGLLVCTDFDCTLAHNGRVSKENLDAIARFQQGGGRITLATGRYPGVLKDYGIPLRCNAPLICMNGAILYDETEDRYITKLEQFFFSEVIEIISRTAGSATIHLLIVINT